MGPPRSCVYWSQTSIIGQVLELEPGSAWAKRCLERLEPLVSERHEKLKNEVR